MIGCKNLSCLAGFLIPTSAAHSLDLTISCVSNCVGRDTPTFGRNFGTCKLIFSFISGVGVGVEFNAPLDTV